jgi:hypothetical protein
MFFIIFAAESKNIGNMRHLIVIIITLMIQPIYIKGDNNQLYKQLDAALAQRAHYVELKEKSGIPEESNRTVAKERCILLLPDGRIILFQQSSQQ